MLKKRLARSISLVLAGFTLTPAVHAQVEGEDSLLIRVTEGQSAEAARLSAAAVQSEPAQRLSGSASVSLSRTGGRGLDPVIRGQNEERGEVRLDGMGGVGACRGRRDTTTRRLRTVRLWERDAGGM